MGNARLWLLDFRHHGPDSTLVADGLLPTTTSQPPPKQSCIRGFPFFYRESHALAVTRHGGGVCIRHHDGHHGLESAAVLGEEILHEPAPLWISYSDTYPRFLSLKYSLAHLTHLECTKSDLEDPTSRRAFAMNGYIYCGVNVLEAQGSS